MQHSELVHLISKIKQGDQSEFRRLVEEYQQFAYSLAFRILCDEEEAKDAVQDSFIKIWKRINSFDTRYKFTTWMYKIVTHTAIDRYRTMQKRTSIAMDEAKLSMVRLSENDESLRIENRELGIMIKHLADKLPEKQRHVFVLRDLQGMGSVEVQEILDMTATMVKSNLYCARKALKQKLTNIMVYERR